MQLGQMQKDLINTISLFLFDLQLADSVSVASFENSKQEFISITPLVVFEDMLVNIKDDKVVYVYPLPDESDLTPKKVMELSMDLSRQYIHAIMQGNRIKVKNNAL